MTFDVRQDRAYLRAPARSTRFLVVRLVAPDARSRSERLPVNVALVLDRSGSMGGSKIRLAKQAVDRAIATLDARDRFAVVFYDDRIDVVVPSTPASGPARAAAREALRAVDARGSTNLFEGWLRGCEQVALHGGAENVSRALLLTDGLANVGVTDRYELETHAAELRRRGVATSTFGVGHDFDEDLLEAMARSGGGNFYYIEHATQIPDFMTSELGEALEVVARDVRIELAVPFGTQVEPLGGERAERRTGDAWSVELGELVARQELEIILRLSFPQGVPGEPVDVAVAVHDRDGLFAGDRATVRWIYADHATNDRQPRDVTLDRQVARAFAARARRAGVALNKVGDYRRAEEELRAVAVRIRGYAQGDPELLALAGELEGEAVDAYAAPMALAEQKMRFAQSSYALHRRSTTGKALRVDRP
jgi:Ca-activated chloride channel family protein